MDYEKYLNLTNDENYIKLYEYYMEDTYLDVLGVARQENPHSSFIRWLLDSKSSHALGDYPIKKLVELLIKNKIDITDNKYAKHAFHKNNEDAIAYMKYSNYEISNVGVETEKIIDKGRADIVITFNANIDNENKRVIILIENKIHSSESENQTNKYEKYLFDDKNSYEIVFPVFLTVDGKKAKSKAFQPISYQELLDNVIEPCYLFCDLPNSKNRIYEYIRCLGQLRGLTEENKSGNDVIAISSIEKNMVLSLYGNHDDNIIIEILKSINVDNEIKLSDAQCSFWQNYAFALDKTDEPNKNPELKEAIDRIIKSAQNRYIYKYKKVEYKSKSQHTIGSLFYDIIKEVAERDNWNKKMIEDVRNELQTQFNPKFTSWLRDIIVFDKDAKELEKSNDYWTNYGQYNKNRKKPGKVSESIEEFADCFYVSDSVKRNQISISNYSEWNKVIIPDESNPESRFYLASYWGSGDVEKMIKLADGDNANSPIKSILEEFKKVEKI